MGTVDDFRGNIGSGMTGGIGAGMGGMATGMGGKLADLKATLMAISWPSPQIFQAARLDFIVYSDMERSFKKNCKVNFSYVFKLMKCSVLQHLKEDFLNCTWNSPRPTLKMSMGVKLRSWNVEYCSTIEVDTRLILVFSAELIFTENILSAQIQSFLKHSFKGCIKIKTFALTHSMDLSNITYQKLHFTAESKQLSF